MGKDATVEFCKGYAVYDGADEFLFAVFHHIILKSGPHPRGDKHFDREGRVWTRVYDLPECAECIGTYLIPTETR